jgi:hypothetical protein
MCCLHDDVGVLDPDRAIFCPTIQKRILQNLLGSGLSRLGLNKEVVAYRPKLCEVSFWSDCSMLVVNHPK